MKRRIELLSPARNLECGIEAIRHGADAVYIGGPSFGARAAAGNSVEDISRLCQYAHIFGAKIYVTTNTILKDDELDKAEHLAWELHEAGVDALIVQDLAFLKLNLPPIPLHASTQMDNRSANKAQMLEDAGFSQIVLARELSIPDIAEICRSVSVPIEVFVHGALCVSYSGRCYASQYCFQRSANRGECAQFCRLAFDLIDANGKILVQNKHLLSLRDLNRSSSLEELLDAGVSSFKIEGRLKDISYVKNITAYYRQRLDEIIAKRNDEFERASFGQIDINFTPQPAKSFNRNFTQYFLHSRTADISSFDTPKATGEYVGTVKKVSDKYIIVAPATSLGKPITFSNGDGMCFFTPTHSLQGFRINKAEDNQLWPTEMPKITAGTKLFRNIDQQFEKQLSRPSATRTVAIDITLRETEDGYALEMMDEAGRTATHLATMEKQKACTPQQKNIIRQLSKLGGTHFSARSISIETEDEPFIPASFLAEWRRACITKILSEKRQENKSQRTATATNSMATFKEEEFAQNISNRLAREYCTEHGIRHVKPAYELLPSPHTELMRCRHCLRYSFGHCPKVHTEKEKWEAPLFLRLSGQKKKFPLAFDCKNCQMVVCSPE